MKQWQFWPQATWFGVCGVIVLAVASVSFREADQTWLDAHVGYATVLAGTIQAIVLAVSIALTYWATRWSVRQQRVREEEVVVQKQRRAEELLENTARRLESFAGFIDNDDLNLDGTFRLIVRSVEVQIEALGKFQYIDLRSHKAVAAFEAGYGSLVILNLHMTSALSENRRIANDQKSHWAQTMKSYATQIRGRAAEIGSTQ